VTSAPRTGSNRIVGLRRRTMTRRELMRTSALAAGAASLAGILAACGDGDGSGSSDEFDLEHDFSFVPFQGVGDPDSEDEVQFSELFDRGVPVVLNFWAGQCPPCRAEMPHFQRIADEYGDDLVLFGLDVGVFTFLGTREDAIDLLDELDITYPAGYAVDQQPLRDYNVTAMPTTIFFKPNGDVDDRRAGLILEDEMRERIERLF
jgi:thiol-disulfide isomerase/thioredoxin